MSTLAIDIGGTKIAAALVSSDCRIFRRYKIATPASAVPQLFVEALSDVIEFYRESVVNQVAVASTGIISNGILTAINPDNLGGLNQFPIQSAIEELTNLSCHVLNDGQAAAWGEYSYFSKKIKNLVFITVSTGVGGGIIINGELLTGKNSLAGHIGHTQISPQGPVCGCGRVGCVEVIASGRGIASAASMELEGLDAQQIFRFATQGDTAAKQLILRSADAIAQLIANLKAMLDIECVVLGGSIGLADGYLSQVYSKLLELPKIYHTSIRPAHYQHDAGLLGAALWVTRNL